MLDWDGDEASDVGKRNNCTQLKNNQISPSKTGNSQLTPFTKEHIKQLVTPFPFLPLLISSFIGTINQVVPSYSAIKFNGCRLSDMAKASPLCPSRDPCELTRLKWWTRLPPSSLKSHCASNADPVPTFGVCVVTWLICFVASLSPPKA